MLPEDVLLDIFAFYVDEAQRIQAWQSLVHVCGRWRSVVFGSPNRLNLRLVCTAQTPARDILDVWPALPILVQNSPYPEMGLDDVVAVIRRSDRVHRINLLNVSSSDFGKLAAAMQVPFPELTNLLLRSHGEVVLPDSFLGGTAPPRLQFLSFRGIPFPGLSKLLSSATHLVDLHLDRIPHSGYISPEAMAIALSTLTSLEELLLEFESPLSRPDRATRPLPPPTRSVLSVLKHFRFKGDREYLDDLVARIDAPRLGRLHIIFFNDIIFDTPQLLQFICRTPRLGAFKTARAAFYGSTAGVNLTSLNSRYEQGLDVEISCRDLDWQVSFLEQVCTSSLPPLSSLEHLHIYDNRSKPQLQDNIENVLWLELLHPFGSVKNLCLSEEFALLIAPALQELVEDRATEVLPNLQNIFLEKLEPSGPVQEGIGKFVAMRLVTRHPIVVSRWDRNPD
jgi:hypothetical protein